MIKKSWCTGFEAMLDYGKGSKKERIPVYAGDNFTCIILSTVSNSEMITGRKTI